MGVMLNSASMPRDGPGGLIRVGAVPGPVAVDYSGLASTYDRVRSSPREVQEFWLPALTRLADVPEGSLVLDVGCGTGRLSVPLSERHRVGGVDASCELVGVARANVAAAR